MTHTQRWLWLVLVFFPLVVGAQTDPVNLAGEYTVAGTTAQGPYKGHARLQQRGRTVLVEWRLEGGEAYRGLGLTRDDFLVVGWASGELGAAAIYTIEPTLRLRGEWPDGTGAIYSEVLTPIHSGRQAYGIRP